MSKPNILCFVAGRSGGHVLPAITLADQHKKKFPSSTIVFISASTKLEAAIIKENPHLDYYYQLTLENVPTKWYKLPLFAGHLLKDLVKSVRLLRAHKPTRVISTGGYISFPVCLAAWFLRIPIELWELNATPGRATKLLAPFAHTIHICFAQCAAYLPQKKTVLSTYPLRFNIPTVLPCPPKLYAKAGSDKKTILILGGSQGSVYINSLIKQWVTTHPTAAQSINIIHQTGATDATDWPHFYKNHGITALTWTFTHDIERYYPVADVVICRAGAGTLFETAFFKKKAIVIPLETATTDHQVDNANAIAQQYPELFSVVRQADIERDPALFYAHLTTMSVQSNP